MTKRPRQKPPSTMIGLIGSGIGASLTPSLHEEEARALGLSYAYRLLDLDEIEGGAARLKDLLEAVRLLRFNGLNITHPCKQTVMEHLDELSPDVAAIGAVNTVVNRGGRLIGHNTDWFGFANGFKRGLPRAKRKRVVQLGAGGAGCAVAYACMVLGVGVLDIVDIDGERAASLAEKLCGRFGAGRVRACRRVETAMAEADGLINATPVGMKSHPGVPLAPELLRPEQWVAEIIYFPLETELLRAARALCCRTLDGGGMAVYQAVAAFELFTSIRPSSERMLKHFEAMARARYAQHAK